MRGDHPPLAEDGRDGLTPRVARDAAAATGGSEGRIYPFSTYVQDRRTLARMVGRGYFGEGRFRGVIADRRWSPA